MKVTWFRRPTVLLLVLGCFVVTGVAADEYHFINTFIGDRAAGMGGAYTAIADGPEGMYYNPAGLAFAPANYVSVSTNAFEFRNSVYEDLEDTGVDFTRDSFTLVPNFFGFVQRGTNSVWGFTIFSPDSVSVNLRDTLVFQRAAAGQIIDQQKTIIQDFTYNVSELGPAVGILLGDKLGVGGALFGGYIQDEQLSRETDRHTRPDGFFLYQEQRNTTENSALFTLRPQIGVQFLPSDTVSVGVSTTARIPIYREIGRIESYTVGYDDPIFGGAFNPDSVTSYDTTTSDIFNDGLFSSTAIENRLGVAWFASPRLIVSGDVMAYIPLNPSDTPAKKEQQFTWNAALGTEYYVGQNFPLRFGLFTNNANTRPLKSGETGQPEHVDLYGATASIGFATADITLSIGGMYSYGIGEGQLIGGSTDIQTLRSQSTSVFVSGGYLF